ncbi:MAG TPA: hypothetical protein VMB84_15295 [Stellaceae bacterium]|nr:hypothetical protein [Stellaceae bacterium]
MMNDSVKRAREQARLKKTTEQRRLEAIEDIADSLHDLKDELMQIRLALTANQTRTVPPFRP